MDKLQEIQNKLKDKFEALSKNQPPHIEAAVATAGGALQGNALHAHPGQGELHYRGRRCTSPHSRVARCTHACATCARGGSWANLRHLLVLS
jgi:hypothetical protein